MDQVSLVPQHPPHLPVAFSGDRKQFFHLVLRGAALELITVGFYRFWLATDIRRHLWSNTLIDGDAAEYTGRAKELLIGFLFALAIIVPVYLAYFLVSLEAERAKAFASFPLLAFFYLFGQFAIYRARRYCLTRTVWRGVRFWMSGSGWTMPHARHSGPCWLCYPLASCCRGVKQPSSATRCGIPITAICRAVLKARAGSSSSAAGGCGYWRLLPFTFFRSRPSSTARSRRWNGAGGFRASASAA